MAPISKTCIEPDFKLMENGTRSQRIKIYVNALEKERPEMLEEELKMMYLRMLAKKIDDTTLKNDIALQEIIDEVNTVRKEMYENRSSI